MAETHKKFGGSTIPLGLLCPGSWKAREENPSPPGEAAERGTRIHSWLERYLTTSLSSEGFTLSERDLQECKIAVAAGQKIKAVLAELGFTMADVHIEEMLDFHPDYPEAGGTPDVDGFKLFGDGITIDYKSGNQLVSAEKNDQLIFYAVSRYNKLDPMVRATLKDWHFVIVQSDSDGEIHVRKWSLPAVDLPAYEAIYKAAIDRAIANPYDKIPGDHCMDYWCPIRSTCQARSAWINEQSAGIWSGLLEGQIEQPRGIRLSKLLSMKKHIIDVLTAAENDAVEILKLDPTGVPEFHLEDGEGNRAWQDEDQTKLVCAVAGLEENEYVITKVSTISPAQLEKVWKAKNITVDFPATVRPSTGKKLKPGSAASPFESLATPAEAQPEAPKSDEPKPKRTRKKKDAATAVA
ncbi:MAG TPA: DUF2800 domain-containing protein [Candidatus Obscuribacterales bacterium]